jgi:hypothetical protein
MAHVNTHYCVRVSWKRQYRVGKQEWEAGVAVGRPMVEGGDVYGEMSADAWWRVSFTYCYLASVRKA